MDKINYISAYYDDIKAGRAVVGRWIKTLYEYINNALANGELIYNAEKATKAVEWIENHCYHVEGPLAPNKLVLEPWQRSMIACIFGLMDPQTGLRQFREILLVVARKNGKSIIASAIENYVFQVDGGFGARIYNIAPKLAQADIIYLNTWSMITLDPAYRAAVDAVAAERKITHAKVDEETSIPKRRVSDIFIPDTNSTIKKIAFSAKKSDGFNPSLCVCDEIASWEGDKGLKTYEVLKSGMGARPEGIMLSCTTSGYINDSIYDELTKRATRFLLGDSKERRLLPFLYMIDDAEKWDDLHELRKSNPNLGVSVSEEYMREELAIAEGSLSKRAEFITKYCNLKQNSSLAWLPAQTVERASGAPLLPEDFRGCYCVGGIDLSQTRDLTACCVVIERGGELYVIAKFFMPAERIDEATARDGVPYGVYVQRGLLQPSGDNFIDYHDCYNWFVELVSEYQIFPLKTGYDRYSAQYLVQDMQNFGFHMDDVFQGENIYPVILEVGGLLEDGKIHIGDNDLLKIHLLNSAIKMSTERGRGKLVKLSPSVHIDGTAALLDAMTVRQKYFAEIGEQLHNGS